MDRPQWIKAVKEAEIHLVDLFNAKGPNRHLAAIAILVIHALDDISTEVNRVAGNMPGPER